ncbi:hypothetical protein MHEL_30140 [Mycolicibacterium helvum]|uniref:Uncharacterized protein n=1 Tax=Mycolicibacterium helvum TaxID=1534349 RepID=A0A7I7T8D9_9MYCO|nr:hypothetical protein MHEL_30140 [Mycolicibacterium helvum]
MACHVATVSGSAKDPNDVAANLLIADQSSSPALRSVTPWGGEIARFTPRRCHIAPAVAFVFLPGRLGTGADVIFTVAC